LEEEAIVSINDNEEKEDEKKAVKVLRETQKNKVKVGTTNGGEGNKYGANTNGLNARVNGVIARVNGEINRGGGCV
jgi:hypothetical protein